MEIILPFFYVNFSLIGQDNHDTITKMR